MKKFAITQKGQTRIVEANSFEEADKLIGNRDWATIREVSKRSKVNHPTGPAAPLLRKMFNI